MAKKEEDKFTETLTARVTPGMKAKFMALVAQSDDKLEAPLMRQAVKEFVERNEGGDEKKDSRGNHPVPDSTPSTPSAGKLRKAK